MENAEKKKCSTKKRWKCISIIACVLLFVIIFRYVFFPSGMFCDRNYKNIEMYMDGSYAKIGFGFHDYGKVASQWLPKPDELPSGATVLSFFFMHGSFIYRTYGAFVLITQYQDEATYQKLREELLTVEDESDLTQTSHEGEDYYYRVMARQKRINGENATYLMSNCDLNQRIIHIVYFDTYVKEAEEWGWDARGVLSDMSYPFELFYFDEIHPDCDGKAPDWTPEWDQLND
ncbi:MAG: hypothetical protein IJW22_01500 [Clostridia bacterium]|nr:hypothetical protein [Clostridia bacterium]